MLFDLHGKKVFIAGETGLVGCALSKRLEQEECTLLSAPHSVLDLTDKKQTADWFQKNKPDVVIMAAGLVGGIIANSDRSADFISQNLSMALNVIDSSFKAGIQKLLYLGSSCIYPRDCPQPIKEEYLFSGRLEQTNESYAMAKIAGIKMCQSYRKQHGCDFISAMPSNLYGPYDRFDAEKSHVIPALILKIHQAKMRNDSSLSLIGSGRALREFLYVDDLADALIVLLKNYSDDVPANIGSSVEISIHDLAQDIANIVGYKGEIIFNGQGPDGTPRKILDSSKINALGWKASTNLKEGLKKTYDWFLTNAEDKVAA